MAVTNQELMDKLVAMSSNLSAAFDVVGALIEGLELVNYLTCGRCHGAGTVVPSYDEGTQEPDPVTCPICAGAGEAQSGRTVEQD